MDPSSRRRIGSTDIQIPILGLGTAPIGGLYGPPVADADAVALMRRVYELGIRVFDTAPEYGSGFAELRLGEVLPELPRDEIVVSTKVGKPLRPISFAAKTKRVLSESLRSGDVRRITGDAVGSPGAWRWVDARASRSAIPSIAGTPRWRRRSTSRTTA